MVQTQKKHRHLLHDKKILYQVRCGVYTHSGRFLDLADSFEDIERQWGQGGIMTCHNETGKMLKIKATDVAYIYEA